MFGEGGGGGGGVWGGGGGGGGGGGRKLPLHPLIDQTLLAQHSILYHCMSFARGWLQGVKKVASCWKLGVESCIEQFQHIIYESTCII